MEETKRTYFDADFVILENIKECELCQGTVDKYPHTFKCRDCGALGDTFTGIMVDLSYKPEKNPEKKKIVTEK